MLVLALCTYILQVLYLGSINCKCELFLIALVRIVSVNVIFFTVARLCEKKNHVGKEQVAKLVDDTYRFVFCILYLSFMI
jgi:hypothetical protein